MAARMIGRAVAESADRTAPVGPRPVRGSAGRPGWAVVTGDWLPTALVPPALLIGAVITRGAGSITVVGVLAAIVGCVPLGLRRRLPFLLFAPVLTAGIVLVVWQLNPGDVVALIPLIALFEMAQHGDRRRSLWIALITVPSVAVSIVPFGHNAHPFPVVVYNITLCLLAIVAGDVLRSRQESARRAAAAREQETLRRVGEERLQVAHEIHDVVAHAMTAINVQAGVAAHLLERDPANAHDALRNIKQTSGEALRDLRTTLEFLRDPDQAAPLTVPSGLGDLESLATGVRAAGLETILEVGPLGEVPAVVHSAGYRIVQEALTNIVRHADARHAWVRVARDPEAIRIEVADDGAAASAPAPSAGNGVRGMRERARALGGTLEAAPAPGGGWRVTVSLPAPAGHERTVQRS